MKVYVDDILTAPLGPDSGVEAGAIRRSVLNSRKLSTHTGLTQLTLVVSDLVALCTIVNILLISSMVSSLSLPALQAVLAAFLLFPLAYTSFGLYKPIALRPEREIFSFFKANTAVIAGLSVPVFFVSEFQVQMLLWLAIATPLLIFIVPLFRVMTRSMFSRATWWGGAALVISSQDKASRVVQTLLRHPELGIKPAAVLQNEHNTYPESNNVPVIQGIKLYRTLMKTHQVPNVVLALEPEEERQFLKDHGGAPVFEEIYLARENRVGRFSIRPLYSKVAPHADFFNNKITFAGKFMLKRCMDLTGAIIGLVVLAPFFMAIALLIKLTSPGPVLFRQERMGKNGRLFKVYKFRTMHLDAEEKLQEMLKSDPIYQQEYEIFHKLRDDPRVTSIGNVLRRYSLDEFPQLLNVLTGDMSLVGPRAYIPRELPNMLGMEEEVLKSHPGLTGLWQVSGRNHLSFEERVTIDVSYQEAWSLSLDYYILLKTLPVVLTGNGAS